jgi:chromosome segregation ATPase
MSAVGNLISRAVNGKNSVEETQRAVERAAADLQAEEGRIQSAEAEIERITSELRAADPDGDAKGFACLVQGRDALRGRIEAHRARRERMAQELEAAKQAYSAAVLKTKQAELDALDAQIREEVGQLTAGFRAMVADATRRITAHRDLAAKAGSIETEIKVLTGQRPYPVDAHRGSPWTNVVPGEHLLTRIDAVLGGRP